MNIAGLQKTTLLDFPGHIACSSASRSEIVVPLFIGTDVTAVLDIDSQEPDTFDETDKEWLEKIADILMEQSA